MNQAGHRCHLLQIDAKHEATSKVVRVEVGTPRNEHLLTASSSRNLSASDADAAVRMVNQLLRMKRMVMKVCERMDVVRLVVRRVHHAVSERMAGMNASVCGRHVVEHRAERVEISILFVQHG